MPVPHSHLQRTESEHRTDSAAASSSGRAPASSRLGRWPSPARRVGCRNAAAVDCAVGARQAHQHARRRGQLLHKRQRDRAARSRFKNQYEMDVAGNLFVPKDAGPQQTAHPAIVVGHPMGAVKEQSANLYATKMAEQGFVTLSIDLPFWGESEGRPRNARLARPLCRSLQRRGRLPRHAALRRPRADRRDRRLRQRQLCHQRGQDRPAHEGHRHRQHVRHGRGQPPCAQQIADAGAAQGDHRRGGASSATSSSPAARRKYTGGTVHEITADSHPIEREFYDFYRTPRGEYTPPGQSPLLTTHPR